MDGFVNFDPLAPTPEQVPALPTLPSRPARNSSPRLKGPPTQSPAAQSPAAQSPPAAVAPWLQSDEVEERERKEEMRKALRKKIQSQRSSRTRAGGSGSRAREAGGGDAIPDAEHAQMRSQLDAIGGMSRTTLQQLASKMGVSASQMPSKRQLMRRLNGMSIEELVAKSR